MSLVFVISDFCSILSALIGYIIPHLLACIKNYTFIIIFISSLILSKIGFKITWDYTLQPQNAHSNHPDITYKNNSKGSLICTTQSTCMCSEIHFLIGNVMHFSKDVRCLWFLIFAPYFLSWLDIDPTF